ncbi:Radial spoke head 10-like B [Papilio machaon]|uniref:Radial spoke head 10-like B n=1 Tax=Papilio machaon TaxID=76193 RepID=A0A194QM97_PAPMA|nr:Radial spoke head 10-like B [Papilio machaon]
MRCLPFIDGGVAQKENIAPSRASPPPSNPLPFPSFPYKKRVERERTLKLGLRHHTHQTKRGISSTSRLSSVWSRYCTRQAGQFVQQMLLLACTTEDTIPTSWWTAPDERAVIRFRNGNLYEGNISMKAMHGDGIYVWADGTVYTGCFKDNEMNGRGVLQWKDDTWYDGDFAGNLRHGKGMYVDSRRQRSYIGEWYTGTKHGRGTIYYSETFKNSYDGQWVYNVRHGYGSREYCPQSVYEGEWDLYIREGKGLMVWPNHDVSYN